MLLKIRVQQKRIFQSHLQLINKIHKKAETNVVENKFKTNDKYFVFLLKFYQKKLLIEN